MLGSGRNFAFIQVFEFVGLVTGFKKRSDPGPVCKIWSDPDPIFKIWSDLFSTLMF